jgi:hypothetical protein
LESSHCKEFIKKNKKVKNKHKYNLNNWENQSRRITSTLIHLKETTKAKVTYKYVQQKKATTHLKTLTSLDLDNGLIQWYKMVPISLNSVREIYCKHYNKHEVWYDVFNLIFFVVLLWSSKQLAWIWSTCLLCQINL